MTLLPAIDRYIFRLVVMPMIGVFVIAATLLMLDKMLKLFDFVASMGGPVGVVFRMLANMLPEYASLAIPLGLLLGTLLALWGPFALFSLLIGWMYWKVAYVPGGQPIAALEKFAATVGKLMKRLVQRHPAARKLAGAGDAA